MSINGWDYTTVTGSSDPRTLSSLGYGWIVLHECRSECLSTVTEVLQADLGAGLTIEDATIWRLKLRNDNSLKQYTEVPCL